MFNCESAMNTITDGRRDQNLTTQHLYVPVQPSAKEKLTATLIERNRSADPPPLLEQNEQQGDPTLQTTSPRRSQLVKSLSSPSLPVTPQNQPTPRRSKLVKRFSSSSLPEKNDRQRDATFQRHTSFDAGKLRSGGAQSGKNSLTPSQTALSHIESWSSFRSVGSTIKGLIRAKNAFRQLKTKRPEKERNLTEETYVIQDLPKKPRFASTLSAEAQYAMMKGYEDKLFNRLTVSYPKYRTTLRRNDTPCTGVEVTSDLPVRNINVLNQITEHMYMQDNIAMETPENDIAERTSPGRRPWSTSTSCTNVISASSVPTAKQLVMTCRYEKAMDIYDVLRQRDGDNVLSTRIKAGQHDPYRTPVREFNSWATVWKREFRAKRRHSMQK